MQMYKYCDYYLTLEDDLIRISRFVDFNKANYPCYSIEFARIIIAAGAELDMLFQELCKKIAPKAKPGTIGEYYEIIKAAIPEIFQRERFVHGFELILKPFNGWSEEENPKWRSLGYNKIKHERNDFFYEANLENSLNIVAAVNIVLYCFYKYEYGEYIDFGFNDIQKLMIPYLGEDPEKDSESFSVNMNQ